MKSPRIGVFDLREQTNKTDVVVVNREGSLGLGWSEPSERCRLCSVLGDKNRGALSEAVAGQSLAYGYYFATTI